MRDMKICHSDVPLEYKAFFILSAPRALAGCPFRQSTLPKATLPPWEQLASKTWSTYPNSFAGQKLLQSSPRGQGRLSLGQFRSLVSPLNQYPTFPLNSRCWYQEILENFPHVTYNAPCHMVVPTLGSWLWLSIWESSIPNAPRTYNIP